jgi:hypothetical protein
MLSGALIFALALAWGQSSGPELGLSPGFAAMTDDGGFFLPGPSELQPAVFPDFDLPRPSAPPPSPPVAAEEFSLPATRLTMTWLSGVAPRGFGMIDLDLNHTWLAGYDENPPLAITPGVGLHLWSGPGQLNLPARVYDAYLDFNWRPLDGERWGLSVGLTPGWYGDFQGVDGKTFQLTGWLLANRRFGTQWNALGGIAYVRQLRSHLLPVGGLVWTPTDDTRLELVIPKPRLVHRYWNDASGSAYWYVAGQLGGGAWAVADTPTQNVLVSYSDLRLLVGLESIRVNGREWNFEVGYAFARRLAIDRTAAQSVASAVVLQASVGF